MGARRREEPAMTSRHRNIRPEGWTRPRGYANGIAAEGRTLFVAGQIGWDPRSPTPVVRATFAEQFDQALANVVEVVRAAGGTPEDLVRVTLYVTDKGEYQAAQAKMGEAWRRHVGTHYPAMTLIQVGAL